MDLIVSVIVAYFLAGLTKAYLLWNPSSTERMTLFRVASWWLPEVMASDSPRAVAAVIIGAILQTAVMGGFVYGWWWLSSLLANGSGVRLIVTAVGIAVTAVPACPVVNVLLSPITAVLAIPVRLIFPGRRV
jgi:hypothetical protein